MGAISEKDVVKYLNSDELVEKINTNHIGSYSQWRCKENNMYFPVANTVKVLPSGYYRVVDYGNEGLGFEKCKILSNKLIKLKNSAIDLIKNDLDKFWELKDVYKKYDRVYRRNYLLYSAPGTGKTSLINLMCQELIEKYDGIIVSLSNDYEVAQFCKLGYAFRNIEPERKMIVIIEDIDNFVMSGGINETPLLNLLDGNLKFENTVIIATTNYPERLTERYINRPSRFDKVVEFPLPNAEDRRIFITSTVEESDLKKIDINKWVKRTKGYTIDHLNELITLYFIIGNSEEESFNLVEKMFLGKKIIKNKESVNNKEIGLAIG